MPACAGRWNATTAPLSASSLVSTVTSNGSGAPCSSFSRGARASGRISESAAAWRLMSNTTSVWPPGASRRSSVSTTAGAEMVPSATDWKARIGATPATPCGPASASSRARIERVIRYIWCAPLTAKELNLYGSYSGRIEVQAALESPGIGSSRPCSRAKAAALETPIAGESRTSAAGRGRSSPCSRASS